MFSKELEEVIEAALADGVLTEKERAVLHKRAQAEGVDPDELDVVLEGRLAKMKKQEDWLRPVPPPQPANNGKHGSISKCPSCGAVVEAGSAKCAECGYVFTNVAANSSMANLSAQIKTIEEAYREKTETYFTNNPGTGDPYKDQRNDAIRHTIDNFPIPTAKDDLLEFILAMRPKAHASGNEDKVLARAYEHKYIECIDKAKLFFGDDPQFQPLFAQYAKDKKNVWRFLSKFSPKALVTIIFIVVVLVNAIIEYNPYWGFGNAIFNSFAVLLIPYLIVLLIVSLVSRSGKKS